MTPIVQVERLGWSVDGRTILDQVSFEAHAGELVAVIGRNGAGKSTLLDILAGLRQPSAGSVTIAGRRVDDWPARDRARVLSHLPQIARADMTFSVDQLVLMGRYPHATGWWESPEDRDAARRAMARCDVLEFRHRTVGTLSGGERQRVLLAACLAQEPRVLLLDEPATFLDVEQQLRCFSTLREEADQGLTCFAVTHDVNLALRFCTRILLLGNRSVISDTSVKQALQSTEWLRQLSPQLDVTTTADGRAWVTYR
jgi:iron complex transport system ATP-binding protein